MPPRTRAMPPLWVRLCKLTYLDPAMASVDRVHDALAHVVGRGSVQRIYEGKLPRMQTLENIATHLGVPLASLLSEQEPDHQPPLPPRDFADRHDVSETDWALLQAAKVTLTDAERKDLLRRHELLIEQATRHIRKVTPT